MSSVGKFKKFDYSKYKEYKGRGKPKSEDMLVIYKDIDKEDDSDFREYVLKELMKQANKMSLSNNSNGRGMSGYGCHIEIIVALNMLMGTMNYVNNSFSNTLEDSMLGCDKMHVESNIDYAQQVVSRIERLLV